MDKRQEDAFWDAVSVFDRKGLLPYVMIVGSWAEYIYSKYFTTGYLPAMRTRDLDLFYPNTRKPNVSISISEALAEKGYIYAEDTVTGTGKFFKENLLEIEFLTRVLGSGRNQKNRIESLNIVAEGLREMNILYNYPMTVRYNEFDIQVPVPAAYVLQKLYTNPTRTPKYKKEKDILAVRELMEHIKLSSADYNMVDDIFENLPKKHRQRILQICYENSIDLTENINKHLNSIQQGVIEDTDGE